LLEGPKRVGTHLEGSDLEDEDSGRHGGGGVGVGDGEVWMTVSSEDEEEKRKLSGFLVLGDVCDQEMMSRIDRGIGEEWLSRSRLPRFWNVL
jgi:hypothetical protein